MENCSPRVIDGRAVRLDPGVHQLRFAPAGKVEQTLKVLVAEGEKNKMISADFRHRAASRAQRTRKANGSDYDAGMDAVSDKKSVLPSRAMSWVV